MGLLHWLRDIIVNPRNKYQQPLYLAFEDFSEMNNSIATNDRKSIFVK